jgi:hypothetical protein
MARMEAVRVVLDEAVRGRLERMASSVKVEVRSASRGPDRVGGGKGGLQRGDCQGRRG